MSCSEASAVRLGAVRLGVRCDAPAVLADGANVVVHLRPSPVVARASGGRRAWRDFEDTCTGPAARDLAASTASPRSDAARVLAAYGTPVDEAQLRACERPGGG